MRASAEQGSQLPGQGPTDVDDVPLHQHAYQKPNDDGE